MAACALTGRGLVHEHTFVIDHSIALVAILAGHVLVGALQRKIGLRLVIEKRGLPVFRVVALFARLRLSRLDELAGVRILVAARALCRRRTERRLGELSLGADRLVTLLAMNFHVRADQRKLRL